MTAFIIAMHLVGIVSVVHTIMNTRTAQGAIAWAVSLIAFPYLAVPIYWVLGRSKFSGYVEARRQADGKLLEMAPSIIQTVFSYRVADQWEAMRPATRLVNMPLSSGNRVDLLIDGQATFESIFAGIDTARGFVLVQFYIIKDDGLGRSLHERLLRKAAEGVRVYLLYDEIGSYALSKRYIQSLREGGVDVRSFNSTRGRQNPLRLNFRNHRKIVVVDGCVAWIGGHNVGDEYLGLEPKLGPWRDTHVRIEGPATLQAQLAFMEDWHWSTDDVLSLDLDPKPAVDGSDSAVLMTPTGPADEVETASLLFTHAINSAQERVWIASPYFVPDQSAIAALQLAALRGVDVRILIADRPDHLIVFLAAFSYIKSACATGAKVYKYTAGFLHQKALLIDDDLTAIGTVNFDNRSFRINFEIAALVVDREFTRQVEAMFLRDFESARLVSPDVLAQKPWWFRFGVRLARLTSPIL